MPAIGIDFGTTNSAVAALVDEGRHIRATDYEPTVLFFEEGKQGTYYVGKEAIKRYVESGLKGRFIRSIKSVLHAETFKFTHIYGKKYYAEDLVALILDFLARQAEDLLGFRPEKVVMGRPARFSPIPEKDALAQKRLAKAAEIAGFKEVEFQLEPIAAAFAYEQDIRQDELVLVGDIGGGTSDFTIMRLGQDKAFQADRQQDIVQATGVRVGGDDFDAEIAWTKMVRHLGYGLTYDSTGKGKMLTIPPHHYRAFCRWENHFLLNTPATLRELRTYFKWTQRNQKLGDFISVLENNLGYSLFKEIENGKIALTHQDETLINFRADEIEIDETVSLPDFSQAIHNRTDQLEKTITGLLAEANVAPDDIDAVFLTGGSSLVRPVREVFSNIFGEGKIKSNDAFTSVAKGLAVQTRYSFG